MKKSQKGFVIPLLIAIVAVLAISGGVYYFSQIHQTVPESPLKMPEFLYPKAIAVSTDNFYYLDSNFKKAIETPYRGLTGPFASSYIDDGGYYFNVLGNPNNLRINIGKGELLNADLDSLKKIVKQYDESSKQWKNITVYQIPIIDIFRPFESTGQDLKKYDNSDLRIYLDNELVREYLIGYDPGNIETK